MPTSRDLAKLRDMAPECQSLSDCEVALCSGIPSLIYAVKMGVRLGSKFENIFYMLCNAPHLKIDMDVVRCFVSEFFTGERTDQAALRLFDAVTDYRRSLDPSKPDEPKLRWILAHAGSMCSRFQYNVNMNTRHEVLQEVGKLIAALKEPQCGPLRVWNTIAQVAVLLRCLQAQLSGAVHQLLGLRGSEVGTVHVHKCKGQTVAEAKDAWQEDWSCLHKFGGAKYPYLVVIIPEHAKSWGFDILLVHQVTAEDMWAMGFAQFLIFGQRKIWVVESRSCEFAPGRDHRSLSGCGLPERALGHYSWPLILTG